MFQPHVEPLAKATLIQSDGMSISYRRVRAGEGKGARRILFFHGFPGSCAQIGPFQKVASEFDLDVVAMDRPGYNQTSTSAGDQREQVNRSTLGLMKHLGWSCCEAISVSGGTPFLLSLVRENPSLVSSFSIVCGLGPVANADFRDVMRPKALLAMKLLPNIPGGLIQKVLPDPSKPRNLAKFQLLRFFLPVSSADTRVVTDPWSSGVLLQGLHEAFLQKGKGPAQDARSYLTEQNIDLKGYPGGIDIWQGDDDHIVPPEMAHRLAKAIPQAKLHIVPGEGHYSLPFHRIADVLAKR